MLYFIYTIGNIIDPVIFKDIFFLAIFALLLIFG